jgi:chaperone modulatory protein CbpM
MKMEENIIRVFEGTVIEEEELSLVQFCSACEASSDEILEMIREGILEHGGGRKSEWRFSYHAVERYRKATRLMNDLDLNLPGVALAFSLLERIDELESRLRISSGL